MACGLWVFKWGGNSLPIGLDYAVISGAIVYIVTWVKFTNPMELRDKDEDESGDLRSLSSRRLLIEENSNWAEL